MSNPQGPINNYRYSLLASLSKAKPNSMLLREKYKLILIKYTTDIHFMTIFVTTLSLILTLFFTLSLYCFGFRANTYFFLVNYGCLINSQLNGCSNNTTHNKTDGKQKKLYGTKA